ncbi:MAG: MFS transporter [Gammaproteobacteria bacterium]|nr:MFS transporter [Gammaproteobacteria bacterium]MBT7372183.1 MFS transporter [Gammaproteobacteria bacterium]
MSKVPLWYRLAWFLGRPPSLSQHQWKVLGLVAAVSFFEQYDIYLFSLNLKQIQDELLIAEADLGFLGAIVRAGAFLSILLAIAADRVGRRVMLLVTVIGYTLFTGATALSPNAESFVVFQFFARGFASAEVIIAAVVIAEEFAPEHRGWGIGALGALQGFGAGFAAIMYGFVEYLPYGWRSLYAIGLVPLLLIAYWRRALPETERYQNIEHTHQPLLKPVAELFTSAPRRTYGLFAAVAGLALAGSSAGFFAPKYLQDVHGWTPANVAMLTIIGGVFAIIGNPLSGWLSDRFGRKPITILFTTFLGLAGLAFYSVSGVLVPVLWTALIFFILGSDVTTTSYSTELFPTRYRSTATGVRGLVSTLGAILALSAISGLYLVFGSNWVAISVLCLVSLIAPVIVWLFLPETAGRKLEEISPDE